MVTISGFSKRRKNLSNEEEELFLSKMKKSFSVKVLGHSGETHTFIVPLNLRRKMGYDTRNAIYGC